MKILQAGAPKSGNFWLYKILDKVFQKSGIEKKSFIQDHPVYPLAKTWNLSYPEQAGIDMIDIAPWKCFYRISSVFRMPIFDLKEYVSKTDHVWTHSRICEKSFGIYPLFDKIIYIIRDPRDRALSTARFAFSDYMLNFFPHGEENKASYLENRFGKMISHWNWHVYDHIRYKKELRIHILFYENLLYNFDTELERMLSFLDIRLNKEEKNEIKEAVTFDTLQAANPNHVRKGKFGRWKKELEPKYKKIALEKTTPLLKKLHYPLNDQDKQLPYLSDKVSKEDIELLCAYLDQ